MNIATRTILASIALLTATAAHAPADAEPQHPAEAVRRAKAIAPYITEETVIVGRFDVRGINAKALHGLLVAAINATEVDADAKQQLLQRIPAAQVQMAINGMQSTFLGSGGSEIYLTFDIPTIEGAGPHPMLIVPLGEDANVPVLTTLLLQDTPKQRERMPVPTTADGRSARRLGDTLLVGPWRQIAEFENRVVSKRPDLVDAFAAAPDSDAQLILTLSSDMRKVLEQMMPRLPERLGGEPATTLTQGARRASLAVDLPPEARLRLHVQSENETAARALRAYLVRLPGIVARLEDLERDLPEFTELVTPLLPRVRGDQLVLDTDEKRMVREVAPILTRFVRLEREQALINTSHMRMRAIARACILYAQKHDQQFPDSLQQLTDGELLDAQMLRNPRLPDKAVGYVYQKPAVKLGTHGHNPSTVVILREAFETWPGEASAAFADGHVVLFRDEQAYRDAITARDEKKRE